MAGIKVTTDCSTCMHKDVCGYKNNAKSMADKLKESIYQLGINPNCSDYDWDTIAKCKNVTITFSCEHYQIDNKITIR